MLNEPAGAARRGRGKLSQFPVRGLGVSKLVLLAEFGAIKQTVFCHGMSIIH